MLSRYSFALVAIAVVLLAAVPVVLPPYAITLMNYVGIGALVALGLVLLSGIGGMTSFGQAAFVGIGAYSTAWLTTVMETSPWLGLLLALTSAGCVAVVLGAVTLRLGGHYLPLSTIAWGMAIYFLFANIPGFGAHDGLRGIPPIKIMNYSLASSGGMYVLIWSFLGGAMILVSNLLSSRQGRAIRSLRGGTTMLASLGVSLYHVRVVTFVVAALLAALAGWLYAHMNRFVSPSTFEVKPSIEFLLMALIGGAGSVWGAVIGAAFVVLLKDRLQDLLPLLSKNAGQLEVVVYSVLLILLLQFARGGLMSLVARGTPRPRQLSAVGEQGLVRRALPERGVSLLSVDGLLKRFGGLTAVNAVSFTMVSGEILGLIGPNGAGKSTLFNLITGALSADAGHVVFAGHDITNAPQRRIAMAGIGRTFQHVKLRPQMSLLDNVLLGTYGRTRTGFWAGALRLDRKEEQRATAEAMHQLARVGLADKAQELAGNLPLGSQRVLEIARALVTDPVLIVLDEPAAGLREQEKQQLATLLRSLKSEGVSILLVEHDMDVVMTLVDRLVVMDFGTKLMEGTPAEVRADPRVQAAYLGASA